MDRVCDDCCKQFISPYLLKRHRLRKTPCRPIINIDTQGGHICCKYCGRLFATTQSMIRHMRQYCKIATSDEGMKKLFNHTLQRQLADQKEHTTRVEAQVADLTAMMAQLMEKTQITSSNIASQNADIFVNNTGTLVNNTGTLVNNTGTLVNNTGTINSTHVNTTVHIHPWSSEEKLVIPATMLKAAFTENKRLIEYCMLTDEQKTDPEMAAPYVLEALVDLTKRAHADPAARNVYLNPHRADQVMVFDETSWQVRPLVDAIRSIFDSVADNIHRIIVRDDERRELPLDVQSSAAWIPNMYEDAPGKYTAGAKPHMSAHLRNNVPALGSI
jgi:hypothetical protein